MSKRRCTLPSDERGEESSDAEESSDLRGNVRSNSSSFQGAPSLIMSFNTWGIYFASPRPFTRPRECANMIKRQLESFSGLFNKDGRVKEDKLVFVCIQEAWAVQGGLLTPLIMLYACVAAPFYGFWQRFVWPIAVFWNIIGCAVEILLQVVVSAIFMPIFQFTWLTQINEKYWYSWVLGRLLPYSVYPRNNELVLGHGKLSLLDSGLLILSNHPVSRIGFQAYEYRDEPVGKGVMWAYYEQFNIAILTTHVGVDNKSDQDNRIAQVNQILKLMDWLESTYPDIKCYVCGDFNRCLNWPEFIAARSLNVKYARVGAVKNDFKWGNPKVKPLKDWDIADRPSNSTSLYGVLDGFFVPQGEKESYKLGTSPISMLVGEDPGSCGSVKRVSDHSLLWVAEKGLTCWPTAQYWPENFHPILQLIILIVPVVFIIVIKYV